MTRDGWHLFLAFRCMRSAHPHRVPEVIAVCRADKRQRKALLVDFRAHWAFRAICHLHRIKP